MMIYFEDCHATFPLLTQTQKGDLWDALVKYGEDHEEYNGDDIAVKMAFSIMARKIERDQRHLQEKRDRNRANATGNSSATADDGQRPSATADDG